MEMEELILKIQRIIDDGHEVWTKTAGRGIIERSKVEKVFYQDGKPFIKVSYGQWQISAPQDGKYNFFRENNFYVIVRKSIDLEDYTETPI